MLDPVYSMVTLFDQLGLDSSDEAIKKFVSDHQIEFNKTKLHEASIWTSVQADFLREMTEQDADWAVYVDELDAQLRSLN